MWAMPQSLREFYELMHSTIPVRRAMTVDALAGRPHDAAAVDHLRTSLSRLEAVPSEPAGRPLDLSGGGRTHVDLDYEVDGLRKDLVLSEQGEPALREYLVETNERFEDEFERAIDAFGDHPIDTFLTDRDGTVNNYCGRYASSVQSVYNAMYLSRFARGRTINSVVLTSAPLADIGLADLAVTPPGDLILAGSKGREYLDRTGQHQRDAIDPAKQERLDLLNRRLQQVLQQPDHAVFGLIGSGLQLKFGQTTVARQDITGSVTPERSIEFRDVVTELVDSLDPDGSFFRVEDTGLDLELVLTVDDDTAGAARDFDKGDGVRFLDRALGLGLARGACLVCGDTASDVPMLTAALEMAPDTRTVFVTEDEQLQRTVRDVAPDAVFVSRPDTLAAILDALSLR